jgi:ADP-ribosylglycohydrolase
MKSLWSKPLMSQMDSINQARGAMLGMAVGDALGAPLEGLGPQQIKSHYGVVRNYVDGFRAWRRKAERWRLPGLYTDNTQQALSVAETLVECGEMRAVHLAELWKRMYRTNVDLITDIFPNGVHRNISRNFKKSLDLLKSGVAFDEISQPSAGLGAAVRVVPLALAYRQDADHLYHAVVESSLLTHSDIRSVSASLAVAFAVARLLNGEAKNPSFLFHVAADTSKSERRLAQEFPGRISGLDTHLHSISRCIARVEKAIEMPREEALKAIVAEADRHGPNTPCRRPTIGFAPASLATCFYQLIMAENYQDALVDIVNLGGDADSTGAILGALTGAYFGAEAMPQDWLTDLHGRDGIESRTEAIYEMKLASSFRNIPDLIDTEKELCQRKAKHLQKIEAELARIARNQPERGNPKSPQQKRQDAPQSPFEQN